MAYNNTQRYLLLSDCSRAFLAFCVLARFAILFPLIGTRFLPGGIADFFLTVYLTSVLVDGFEYVTIFRKVPKKGVSRTSGWRVLGSIGARALVTALILNYPKSAKNISFSVLISSSMLVDCSRHLYNFYKVRTFGGSVWWLTNLRRILFGLLSPVLAASEAAMIFICLRLMETEYGYYREYIDYDVWADRAAVLVKGVLFAYAPVFYITYKNKMTAFWRLNKDTTKKTN
ncbi:hypothetical protein KL938_003850 [Ogataea parapolymorpha]|nr:hypothetical protein KL938_003850 [Ogataea parapolymorpha]